MYSCDSIEIDLSEICNLKCAQCTHNAPYFTPSNPPYQFEQFEQDIRILSQKVHFKAVRILGGEPLMNKNLINFIHCLVKSKITEQIVLVTNGMLLDQVTPQIFELITSLRVNVYPSDSTIIEKIKQNVTKLRKTCPNLNIIANRIRYFSKTNTIEKNKDKILVTKIYNKCIAGVDGFNLYNGRIYRCFASRRKYQYLKHHEALVKDSFEYLNNPCIDSIKIIPEYNEFDWKIFFEQTTPLVACDWCLGCSGKTFKHEQLNTYESDISTLEDLDFVAGESYLSNCMLSWAWNTQETLKDNPFFKAEHVKDYFKYFTIPPF